MDDRTDHAEGEPSNEPLMAAYRSILRVNIPAFWRILDAKSDREEDEAIEDDEDNVKVELWVFWIDEKHTGIVDRNTLLNELEGRTSSSHRNNETRHFSNVSISEVKVGSFSWENIFASSPSPATSPTSPIAKTNATTNTSLTQEYRFFVKGVRNLICL